MHNKCFLVDTKRVSNVLACQRMRLRQAMPFVMVQHINLVFHFYHVWFACITESLDARLLKITILTAYKIIVYSWSIFVERWLQRMLKNLLLDVHLRRFFSFIIISRNNAALFQYKRSLFNVVSKKKIKSRVNQRWACHNLQLYSRWFPIYK